MYLSIRADGCRRDSGISDMSVGKVEPAQPEVPTLKQETSLEYAKLWEELRHTGQGLDDLFEESKESAFEIKKAYDAIHQLITINEGLKIKYYEALATKKKFDEERDEYFKIDADLSQKKEQFIEDSQKHALQHSRYVEYSKRFSDRREEHIERLLKDVEKYLNQVEKLAHEKQRLRKEVSDQRQEIMTLRNDLKVKSTQHQTTLHTCEKLNTDLEKHKKELQWKNRQTDKLKALNERLKENKNLKNKEQELRDELEKYATSIDEITEKRRQLLDRCSQLSQQLRASEEEKQEETHSREMERKNHEEEKNTLENTIGELTKQKRELRANNQLVNRQMGQLRLKFDNASKKKTIVEKEKNIIVAKEHRTSEKNIELAEKQVELIDEVLALKKVFFADQDRIQKGGRQYRRLEGKMGTLKKQMEMLKEDPSVLDPLEFSQEYRDVLVRRIVSSNSPIRPACGNTYTDNVLKKHVPVIGQIPEPTKGLSQINRPPSGTGVIRPSQTKAYFRKATGKS